MAHSMNNITMQSKAINLSQFHHSVRYKFVSILSRPYPVPILFCKIKIYGNVIKMIDSTYYKKKKNYADRALKREHLVLQFFTLENHRKDWSN